MSWMKMMYKTFLHICLLCVLALPSGHAAGGEDVIPDTAVAVRIGTYEITADNLIESYELTPAFVRLSPDPLRLHLRYLIYEYLLALEAERRGMDTMSVTDRMIRAIEEDLTVDQLYRDDILAHVDLSEENINAGIQKGRLRIRLRWIFTESFPEAEKMYSSYRDGVPFDSLFFDNLPADVPPESRMYEGTQLILERDNPDLMKKIVHLKAQEVSEPIDGPDGFYIFRIDELWQNPILPLHEYTLLKEQATTVLTKIKADEISREYIQELFDEEQPEIIPAGMYIIRAYLADKGLSDEQREEFEIPLTVMTEGGPQTIIDNPELLSMPVARTSGFTITVEDYLDWFEIRQFQIKRHSREAFNASILQTVRRMVQERMLIDRAYERGLNERHVVKHDLQRWRGKILYSVFMRELRRSIQIDEADIQSYYERNYRRFVDRDGRQLSFDEAREGVFGELFHREENRMLHRILRELNAQYEVTINEELIDLIAESIEDEGVPVNVIFYKPGGTFPRVAYPTIDGSWLYFDN
jgi:hypothetical protein